MRIRLICFCCFFCFASMGYAQNKVMDTINLAGSVKYQMTLRDMLILEHNIDGCYSLYDDKNIIKQPVIYDDSTKKFSSKFFLPPNSAHLKSTSKEQIYNFKIAINDLALSLLSSFGLPISQHQEMLMFIEADFVTMEPVPDEVNMYVIGRYRDGKMQLVREKIE